MKTHITLFTLLGLIVCSILPAAARGQGFVAGDTIFSLFGSGSSDDDLDNTAFGAELSLGYFFRDNLAGEVRQGLSLIDVPGSDDDWSAATRGALDLYFGTQDVCPFLGVSLGYVYGDAVSDTWVAGPEAGIRLFVNDTTYITALVEYEFFFDDSDEADDAFDDGRFVYSLGLGFKF
jgi:hypothetical protein